MSILKIDHINKQFGGLIAINDLSLAVEERELRCIIGPNGAGKSTLFNLISGTLRPDAGQILFKGQLVNKLSPARRSRSGIGRKFQTPRIFGSLSVIDNIRVSARGGLSLWRLTHEDSEADILHTANILETIQLTDRQSDLAETLSHGEKQWLEIGMVLAGRPSLMLLDEPTAGMTPAETARTSRLINEIARDMAVIVIEHDLKFVREIANIVTVLHHGSVLVEGHIDTISEDEDVRRGLPGIEGTLKCYDWKV